MDKKEERQKENGLKKDSQRNYKNGKQTQKEEQKNETKKTKIKI